MSYCHGAQKVYAEGPLDCIETDTRRQAVSLNGHAGVVDEDVEMSEICIDRLAAVAMRGGFVEVDRDIADIAAVPFERGCRLFPECPDCARPAGLAAGRGELAGDFESDAFIRSR